MGLNGFIKIHRQIMEWGWYKDQNTKAVFLHLLLKANFKEREYKGVLLKPGQAIIGRKALAEQLGISEQCVRTALNRLKSTNEITIKSTNKFSVVTIENWEMYQSDESESTNESTNTLTNNQPTTNQQLTNNQPHLKNDKKDKNDKNIYKDVPDNIKDIFMEWVEMRNKMDKPILSETGVSRALEKLYSLSHDPDKQRELIGYAIYKNWLSFYPIPQEDKIPKQKEEEQEEVINAVPMPEEVRRKMNALGYGIER